MTAEPYYLKYMNQEPQKTEEEPYYAKYMQQPEQPQEQAPQERGFYENYINRPEQTAIRGLVGSVASAPRTIGELVGGAGAYAGEKLANVIKGDFAKPVEGIEIPEWFKSIFPSYEQVQKGLTKIASGLATAETPLERGTEKVGQMLPFGMGGGGAGLAGMAGAATGMQVAEEYNTPVWAQFLAGGLGDLMARGGYSLRNVRNLMATSRPFRQTLTPEAREYFEASEAMGIDPLASAAEPSHTAQGLQEIISHAPGGYEVAQAAYSQRSAQIAQAYGQTLDMIGNNMFDNPAAAGASLREGVKEATQQVERRKSQLYAAKDAVIPEDAAIPLNPGLGVNAAKVSEAVDETIGLLKETLARSHPESSTYRQASLAKQNLESINQPKVAKGVQLLDAQGNPIQAQAPINEIPIRKLEATQRSLREVIDYNTLGGSDKLLKRIDHAISNTLIDYGKSNKAYATAKTMADDYFKNTVLQIRQNVIQSIANNEIPEFALSKMGSVTGVREVRQALSHLNNGGDLFNSLARFQVNRLIGSKMFNPNTGEMLTGGIANLLNKESRHLINELAGPSAYHRLEQLQHVGRGLQKGFNLIENASKSGKHILTIQALKSGPMQIVSGVTMAATGHPIAGAGLMASGLATATAPRIIAHVLYDPDFARNVFRAAESADRGHLSSYIKYIGMISNKLEESKAEEQK